MTHTRRRGRFRRASLRKISRVKSRPRGHTRCLLNTGTQTTLDNLVNALRNTCLSIGGRAKGKRISEGLQKGQRRGKKKTRGAANLPGVAIKKPTLNYGSALPLFQYTRQYIMHMAVFPNAWNTGGALESMIYGSHIMYYLLVIITAGC